MEYPDLDEGLLRPDLQHAKGLYNTFSDFAMKFQEALDDDHEIGLIPLLPNGELFHLGEIGRKDGVIWFSGLYKDGSHALIITDPSNFTYQLKPVLKLKDTVTRIGFPIPSEDN